MGNLNREKLFDGVYFNHIKDERYKTNKISINLVTSLDEKTASLNALLPNILRKGYKDLPDFTQLNKKLDELYGASLYYGVEKLGDYQVISLSISGIDNSYALENENIIKEMTELLCNICLEPVIENGEFLKEEVALEKKSLIDYIKSEINDKRTYALNRSSEIMCANQPYGINKLGSISATEEITPKSLYEQYKALIKASNIEIMFVGCGDSQDAKDYIKKEFEKTIGDRASLNKTAFHKSLKEQIEVVDEMQISQSKMVLGFSISEDLDEKQTYAMVVLTAIYGGTPMSKLFLNVREKLSLCYYCAGRFDRTKRILKVDCGVEQANIQKAKEAIIEQLDEIKKGNITDEEISNAVMSLKNTYKTISDSTATVESFYLSQIIRNQINSPEEELENIDSITKEEIIEVSKKINLDICYILTSKNGAKEEE